MNDDVRTAFLGRYDEFEAELVLEILRNADIFAVAKQRLEEGEHAQYPGILDERGAVLVDAARVEEAKRVIAEQLPEHLASIREAMAALEAGDSPDGGSDPNAPETGDSPDTDGRAPEQPRPR